MTLQSPFLYSSDKPSSQAPTSRLNDESLIGIQEVFENFRNKHTELVQDLSKPVKGKFLDQFVLGMIFRAWKNLVGRLSYIR